MIFDFHFFDGIHCFTVKVSVKFEGRELHSKYRASWWIGNAFSILWSKFVRASMQLGRTRLTRSRTELDSVGLELQAGQMSMSTENVFVHCLTLDTNIWEVSMTIYFGPLFNWFRSHWVWFSPLLFFSKMAPNNYEKRSSLSICKINGT